MMRKQVQRRLAFIFTLIVLAGLFKFYHYNYIQHHKGQAKSFKAAGFHNFICKSTPYFPDRVDQCGRRSIYGDADWGVTAYISVYGIESKREAEEIKLFLIKARENSNQERIPISLQVFSAARSEHLSKSKDYLILSDSF